MTDTATDETEVDEQQRLIARELGVTAAFEVAAEARRRAGFLTDLLVTSGARTLVLGISGGVDSAAAGALCRIATRGQALRDAGREARFVAVRLPYGRQQDEDAAQLVLDTIQADVVLTVDVRAASDAALGSVVAAGLTFADDARRDFVLGNVKARQRMVAQYAIAGAWGGLVIGTDHAAEAVTGFFTKYGDGGVDANPLAGLTKRRVRALAAHLGLPESIVQKVPTADLESLRPGRADEDALGVTYSQIDDFLEGRPVSPEARATIVRHFTSSAHKRVPPLTPA